MLGAGDADRLERCLADGGVALFPADTVYGLACDADSPSAVERLYELKGRPAMRPAAVLFFSLSHALDALPDLGEAEAQAARALLPGPVTLLVPNRSRRFLPACASDPGTLGVRVPRWTPALAALGAVTRPAMQSSANPSGGADARRLEDVDGALRAGVDLELDGGELPGVSSTVVDLRRWESERRFSIARVGALPEAVVASLLPS